MAVPHVVLVLGLLLSLARNGAAQRSPIGYEIDVTDRSDDQFSVTAWVSGLTPDNAVYQFAATAPGTYQVMDIGRFVRSFEAFDAAGRPVPVERVSVNQWKLGDAPRVRTLRYTVAETWDTKVDRHQVYLMCGTSMEKDHVLINPHAVIGYPTGMQTRPIRLRVKYPASWMVGTALERDRGGAYLAEDYDQLVDSPILLGRLTEARTRVTGVPVQIFTYSKTDRIKSAQLLGAMHGMLQAAGRFLGRLPVDRYTFLYHFEDSSAGAWEHSLSSEYVLPGKRIHRFVGPLPHRHRGARVLPHGDSAQHPQRDHRALQLRDAGAVPASLALRGHHGVGGAHHAAAHRSQESRGIPQHGHS